MEEKNRIYQENRRKVQNENLRHAQKVINEDGVKVKIWHNNKREGLSYKIKFGVAQNLSDIMD